MNRIVTYCFLSVINNMNHKKLNLDHVFIPIIEVSICSLNEESICEGHLKDLQERIKSIFELDMPISLLKKFLSTKMTYDIDFSSHFKLFGDDSFQLDHYSFLDHSVNFEKSKNEVKKLYSTYREFLKNNDITNEPDEKLTEFLSQNSIIISKFFTEKKQLISKMNNYINQVEFLNLISGEENLFDTAKRIYFGSIISSYLEIEYKDIFKKDVAFVLDTNFVLALLDFNSETKTDTANRIVDIANKIGIKLTILDQHLDELKNFLKRKAKEIRSFHRLELIRNDNFFGACDRRRLDKTDLQRYANNINKHILAKKIEIISDYKDGFIEKVRKSTIFQKMQSRTYNPQGAFSDAFAIEYIREERDSSTTDFFESRAWFVCYPLEDHYPHYREDGELYETIFAETLLNILWLTNPTINMQNLDDLGLRRLISETIDSALPSRGILIAIEDKMQIMTEKKILKSQKEIVIMPVALLPTKHCKGRKQLFRILIE